MNLLTFTSWDGTALALNPLRVAFVSQFAPRNGGPPGVRIYFSGRDSDFCLVSDGYSDVVAKLQAVI